VSAKQAINDKFQGTVATYSRCGGVFNNQIRKGLFLTLSVNFFFESVNIWQSYKQERDYLVHFLRLLAVCWPGAQSACRLVVMSTTMCMLKIRSMGFSIMQCLTRHVSVIRMTNRT